MTPEVRAIILRQAARLLQAEHPVCRVSFERGGDKYLARFDWPGVVKVTDRKTGELIAESLPGQPAVMAGQAV
ncbi:MAG: hypothetical protein RL722_2278 [Pseudomonadota bacterium]|jgi:hypothetical protein